MHNQTRTSQTIKSGQKLLSVVEALHEVDGARVTELAAHLDYTKSTVHRYLATLEEAEYVVKNGDTYNVGHRFLELGEYTRNRNEAYVKAKPKVEELVEKTQERAQFLVEEHGQVVYIHREAGEKAVRTDPGIGKRIPIHTASAGKAILAHLPESEVHSILDERGLPALTPSSTTDREELFAQLERTRERGYSLNKNEIIEGLSAIGAVVQSRNGYPIGALSVACPTHRMESHISDSELPDLLIGTANELELNISHNNSP